MNSLILAAMTGRITQANLSEQVKKDNERRVKIFTKVADLLFGLAMFFLGDIKITGSDGVALTGDALKNLDATKKLDAILGAVQATNKGLLFREVLRPFLISAAEVIANLLSPDEAMLQLFMQPGSGSAVGGFLPAAGSVSSAPSAAPIRYVPHFNHYPPAGSVQGYDWNGRSYNGTPPAPGTPLQGQGAMQGWYYDWGQRAWMEPVRG